MTWTMHGTKPYILKVTSLFTDVDRMFGHHFETGLANLKLLAERQPQALA